ncbi:MAG: CBASS cGAMP-activated phospholipase [Fimbriimonadaceae bacterium]
MTFQILSLSGGGYRGLYTIEVLHRLEQRAGRPIGQCFDLIAGTSIGGVIAIGLAMGKSAEAIRTEFLAHGDEIFPQGVRFLGPMAAFVRNFFVAMDRAEPLRRTVANIVGEGTLIGEARTRLLVPTVNVTVGRLQIFKTPHHPTLTEDQHRNAVDVAMATSAAPPFFPLARIGESYFADGGLAANSPDACAIHEAIHFAGQDMGNLRLLSVGTTSTSYGMPTSLGSNWGLIRWLWKYRLINVAFGVQQQLVDFTTRHDLRDRYLRIDAKPSPEHGADIGLDIAIPGRREILQSLAEESFREIAAHPMVTEILAHRPLPIEFPPRPVGPELDLICRGRARDTTERIRP